MLFPQSIISLANLRRGPALSNGDVASNPDGGCMFVPRVPASMGSTAENGTALAS